MSGNKVLPDTNAVGLYLDDRKFATKYLYPDLVVSISVITQLEFLSNPQLTIKNRYMFDEFIELIEIFRVTRENKELVKQVVPIRKKYKIKLPEAVIAATALVNNATLISAGNIFSKVHNLKFQLVKA